MNLTSQSFLCLLLTEFSLEVRHCLAFVHLSPRQNAFWRIKASKGSDWNDKHLAHGAQEVHDETNDELLDSEEAAAWDAHDASDAGVEAAAEERAVMLANEIIHKLKERSEQKKP